MDLFIPTLQTQSSWENGLNSVTSGHSSKPHWLTLLSAVAFESKYSPTDCRRFTRGRKNAQDVQPIIVGWIQRGGCWTVSPVRPINAHYMHPVDLKCPSGTVHCSPPQKNWNNRTIQWKLFVRKSHEALQEGNYVCISEQLQYYF